MRTKLQTLGILAVISISAMALAADGFSVALKPKVGDSRKYNMKADVDFNGTPVEVTAVVNEKVTKVETDGTYTLESAQSDGKVIFNGSPTDIPNGTPTTITYKPTGEVSKVIGDATQSTANSYRMANLSLVFDQGKNVNVGDAWTHEIKADSATGAVAAKADYKLLGEEKVGTVDTLKLKVTIKETAGDTPASSDGTIWIDKADGSMVKTESKWVNAPIPGQPMPLNATVKIDRVEK